AVPIVALTADAVSGAEDRYLEAGMDAYLSKPLSPHTLMATMDALVRGEQGRKLAAPVVDAAAITGLRGFLDDAQFTAFIAEAVRDLAVRIDGLGVRIAAGDLEPVAREAHDLVSAAGNCGAGAVSALARLVEQAARRGDATEAERCFAEMRGAGGRAAEALGELLAA
ncbi:MAG TPA: Hpt domain-containing protein, partial [Rhodopila sp.]